MGRLNVRKARRIHYSRLREEIERRQRRLKQGQLPLRQEQYKHLWKYEEERKQDPCVALYRMLAWDIFGVEV